jgi:zinc D-Ala-D-Ala carboxypeptidase
MTYRTSRKPARTGARRTRSTVLVASVIAGVALIGLTTPPIDSLHGDLEPTVISVDSDQLTTVTRIDATQPPAEAPGQRDDRDGRERRAPAMLLGEADGVVPDGVTVTVFDDDIPAVANLDADLLDALRQAASDAADDGIEFFVNSGWRSPEYQEHLLREAIAQYGSEEEAARWVATADRSAHVSGDAVDIGPADASTWLSEYGDAYGLCQIYGNEPWHFELRPDAVEDGCPPMYDDPTQDPRMQV